MMNRVPSHTASRGFVFPMIALLIFCAALLAIPYSYGVGTMRFSIGKLLWQVWTTGEDMQHGILVLPAALVIIWMSRNRLKEAPITRSWVGLGILLMGLFFYYAGYRGDVFTMGQLGFMLALSGCVLWFWGLKVFFILLFPLAFLLFAFPVPGADTYIAFPLRMFMSSASAAVLDTIGLDVIRQGTGILSAPNPQLGIPAGQRFSVDVADPCSGIRSLFALMMVSALYAHFTMKTWWKKWILFLCALPLAILGNLCRILMLTIGTVAFGTEFAIGKNALTEPSFFHMFAGYLVFIVALGGMVGIGWLLENAGKLSLPKFTASASYPKASPHSPPPQDLY